MDWNLLLSSPIPYLVFAIIIIITFLVVFRRQIGEFLTRLTNVNIETDKTKGAKVSLKAVKPNVMTPQLIGTAEGVQETGTSKTYPDQYIPAKAYRRFIGRRDDLDKLMAALREPHKRQLIGIYGLGGIGKTALVHEAAEICVREEIFDYIVWVSAKTEVFEGEGIREVTSVKLNFGKLLDKIARQCGRLDIAKTKASEKSLLVKELLSSRRILLVIDNLDTVHDSEQLIAKLYEIIGKSKVLLTSRYRIKNEQIYGIALLGLPSNDGVSFLREEGRERGIERVYQASVDLLKQIHFATGGAPLAMRLAVGQLGWQSMDAVLSALRQVSFTGQDYDFYRFIYRHSWELLGQDAKQALVSMSTFAPGIGGIEEIVWRVSQLDKDVFHRAISQLVSMSLVDTIGDLDTQRYALHHLTQYFVLSDIVKRWG